MKKLLLSLFLFASFGAMAQVKISALPNATNKGAGGIIPIVQDGVTKRVLIDSAISPAKRYADSLKAVLSDSIASKLSANANIPQSQVTNLAGDLASKLSVNGDVANLTGLKTVNGISIKGVGDIPIAPSANVDLTAMVVGDYIKWDGNKFVKALPPGISGWGLNGNVVVDSNFIGTTTDKDVIFKRNGIYAASFTNDGGFQVGVGSYAANGFAIMGGSVQGYKGIAAGIGTSVTSSYAVAIGNGNQAGGTSSMILGSNSKVIEATYGATLGNGLIVRSWGGFAGGSYNKDEGLGTYLVAPKSSYVFDSSNTAMSIGNGYDDAHRSDVITSLFNGNTGFNNVTNPTEAVDVNGNVKAGQYKLSALNTAPSSSTDTGVLGEIRVTTSYIYVCTATNTWVRTALTTF